MVWWAVSQDGDQSALALLQNKRFSVAFQLSNDGRSAKRTNDGVKLFSFFAITFDKNINNVSSGSSIKQETFLSLLINEICSRIVYFNCKIEMTEFCG